MGWYEDLLADEERKQREVVGEAPAGATLPELVGQGLEYMRGIGQETRQRMGRETGVPTREGAPIPPFRTIIPNTVDPYTAMMLEQFYPGGIPTPQTTTTPEEVLRKQQSQAYKAKSVAGGWNEVMELTPGKTITVKEDDKTTGVQTVTKTTNKGPKVEGQPAPQIPQAPGVPRTEPPGIGAPPLGGYAGPTMVPGGGYISPEEQRRQQAAKIQYKAPFVPGEEPLNPVEIAAKQKQLAEERKEKMMQILKEAYPERGQVLREGYEKMARLSKGTRIMMSILKGNPWWTDMEAGLEANYLEKRAEAMGTKKAAIWGEYYTDLKNTIDTLNKGQEEKLRRTIVDLTKRLETEPDLVYNRDAQKMYALALGVSAKNVDQYLDDHYDPKTGRYSLLKDPYEEQLIKAKNLANNVKKLYPKLPDEVAILATTHPDVLVEMTLNEAKYWAAKAFHETDPRLKEEYQFKADAALSVQNEITQSPDYRTYLLLLATRRNPEAWNSMPPTAKKQWGEDFLAAHRAVWGPNPERDPERLYLKDTESKVRIEHLILQNKYTQAQLRKMQQDEEGGTPNILMDTGKKLYPILSQKKATGKQIEEAQRDQSMVLGLMAENKIPAPPKDLSKEKPADRELRHKADTMRQEVWNLVPADQKEVLQTLSYSEAEMLTTWIWQAQMSTPTERPNIYYYINLIKKMRNEKKKR